MKKYRLILLLLLAAVVASCVEKKQVLTQDQIYGKFASGVVLIQNTYYYAMTFSNGFKIFFSGINNGELVGGTLDESEVKPVMAFGTGFFVSKDGKIATNSHVVSPTVDPNVARQDVLSKLNEIIYLLLSMQDRHNRNKIQDLVASIERVNSSDFKLSVKSKLKIVYNESTITGDADFKECTLIKDSPNVDLAIIQLKDKTTPANRCVFKTGIDTQKGDKEKPDFTGVEDVKLYMIGFNRGPQLGVTQEGIKAQITQGTISQDTDETKIMYSIPALPGSSGSPVINQYGELVAINFASVDNTQSFNYGIKVKKLAELLN